MTWVPYQAGDNEIVSDPHGTLHSDPAQPPHNVHINTNIIIFYIFNFQQSSKEGPRNQGSKVIEMHCHIVIGK